MELTTGQKVLVVTAITAVVAVSGYFFVYKPYIAPKPVDQPGADGGDNSGSDDAQAGTGSSNSATAAPKQSTPTGGYSGHQGISNDSFPLKKGSKGENVKRLQNALKKYYGNVGGNSIVVDGVYGKGTAAWVKKYVGREEPVYDTTVKKLETIAPKKA